MLEYTHTVLLYVKSLICCEASAEKLWDSEVLSLSLPDYQFEDKK